MLGISSRLSASATGHELQSDKGTRDVQEVSLKVLNGGMAAFPTRTVRLPAIIGRTASTIGTYPGQDNAIFESPLISRKHAEMRQENGHVVVADLGSSNGTLLNGQPLAPNVAYRLNNGDVIQLGSDDEDLPPKDRQPSSGCDEALTIQVLFRQPPSPPQLADLKASEHRKATFSPGRVLEEAKKMLGKPAETSQASSQYYRTTMYEQPSQFWLNPDKERAITELHRIRALRDELRLKLELASSKLARVQSEIDNETVAGLLHVEDLLDSLDFSLEGVATKAGAAPSIRGDAEQNSIFFRHRLSDALRIIVCQGLTLPSDPYLCAGGIRVVALFISGHILLLVFFAVKL